MRDISNVSIDLEFTDTPKEWRAKGLHKEIIEIGAVRICPNGGFESFNMLVKPKYANGVSGSVHWITGIGDEDLVSAKPLDQALQRLADWIGDGPTRMITWSNTDSYQIDTECRAKGISTVLNARWLDLQRIWPHIIGTRKRLIKLSEAADWCGIEFDHDKAHRALYDAQITAELFSMAAAGECRAQRLAIDKVMKAEKEKAGCTARISDQDGAIAAFRARLLASESALCA